MYETRPPASISADYLWRERLEPLLWYLGDSEREMVHEGLELAVRAHSGQMRKSGEPFVTHPVEVRRLGSRRLLGACERGPQQRRGAAVPVRGGSGCTSPLLVAEGSQLRCRHAAALESAGASVHAASSPWWGRVEPAR